MRRCFAVTICLVLVCGSSRAEIPLRAERIATGLTRPLFVTSAQGDPNRIFILEQRGSGGTGTFAAIRIFDYSAGTLNGTNFLTIPNVSTGFEQGALGLAFHPNYSSNGLFYVNLTNSSGHTEIRRYARVDANTASTGFSTVMTINQPQNNHNGGWLGFGPNDGFLYIGTGDGGGDNDDDPGHTPTKGNSQDTTNLLGKMLRIDINGTAVNGMYSIPAGNPFAGSATDAKEIWSYGLRNPWRASFDRGSVGGGTGNFYIGDVGQGAWEEIDFQPGNSVGGENYGWRHREGAHDTGFTVDEPPGMIDPIHEYSHSDGISVTGGYVYRGSENDALQGTYFFGDFGSTTIWSFKYDGTTKTKFRNLTGGANPIIDFEAGQGIGELSSFGEDAQGRIYITDRADGEVYRLVPAFPGDANLDGIVNKADLGAMALNWHQTGQSWADADFTDDGRVDVADLTLLANNWMLTPEALAAALVEAGLPTGVPEPGVGIALAGLLLLRLRKCRPARR